MKVNKFYCIFCLQSHLSNRSNTLLRHYLLQITTPDHPSPFNSLYTSMHIFNKSFIQNPLHTYKSNETHSLVLFLLNSLHSYNIHSKFMHIFNISRLYRHQKLTKSKKRKSISTKSKKTI